MRRSEYRRFRALPSVTLLAALAALSVAGYVLLMTWLHALAFLIGAVLFWLLVRRARSYSTFFRHWRTLSAAAKERNTPRYAELGRYRSASVALAVLALAITLVQMPLVLRSETIRGADLSTPGIVFGAYNSVVAPELAELIDLYVIRNLPLDLVDSGDLRLLRNLYFAAEGYRFDSQDLRAVFEPLLWYRPYRAYPNDLNALRPEYRERVARIIAVELRR